MIPIILSTTLILYYIIKHKEIPESISSMVKKMKEAVWVLWMEAVSFSIAPHIIDTLPENYKVLGFATVISLMFCGAMPLMKNSKNTLHNILGISAGILSQICVAITNPLLLLAWLLIPLVKLKVFKGKEIFITELLCMGTTFAAVL